MRSYFHLLGFKICTSTLVQFLVHQMLKLNQNDVLTSPPFSFHKWALSQTATTFFDSLAKIWDAIFGLWFFHVVQIDRELKVGFKKNQCHTVFCVVFNRKVNCSSVAKSSWGSIPTTVILTMYTRLVFLSFSCLCYFVLICNWFGRIKTLI